VVELVLFGAESEFEMQVSLQEVIEKISGGQQSAAGDFYIHSEFDTGQETVSMGDAKSLMDALNESDEAGLGGSACTQIAVGTISYIIDVQRYTMDEKEGPTCDASVYPSEGERIAICYFSDEVLQDFIEALGAADVSIERDWRGDTFSDNPSYYS
jgi:hypothetical protein